MERIHNSVTILKQKNPQQALIHQVTLGHTLLQILANMISISGKFWLFVNKGTQNVYTVSLTSVSVTLLAQMTPRLAVNWLFGCRGGSAVLFGVKNLTSVCVVALKWHPSAFILPVNAHIVA